MPGVFFARGGRRCAMLLDMEQPVKKQISVM